MVVTASIGYLVLLNVLVPVTKLGTYSITRPTMAVNVTVLFRLALSRTLITAAVNWLAAVCNAAEVLAVLTGCDASMAVADCVLAILAVLRATAVSVAVEVKALANDFL